MRNKKKIFVLASVFSMLTSCVPAYALEMDLSYSYKTESRDEFVIVGETQLNFNGEIPDYLRDIYDITPQMAYDSQYGSNIIEPNKPVLNHTTYAPRYAPSGGFTQSPFGLVSGSPMDGGSTAGNLSGGTLPGGNSSSNGGTGGGTSNKIQEYTYTDFDGETPQYPLTTIEQVRQEDGSIGTLNIPSISLKVTAYDGDTFAAMKKGIGHIASTSCWNGNIGLVGHNRGTSSYFGRLKKLKPGDEMSYTTKLGTRTYVVDSVSKISDTDWSKLQYTSDNRLTLITCVEDVGSQRLCVQAVEKR
jgi:LPXTG-site transpeptidase (sortase) family protein